MARKENVIVLYTINYGVCVYARITDATSKRAHPLTCWISKRLQLKRDVTSHSDFVQTLHGSSFLIKLTTMQHSNHPMRP